MQRTPLQRSDKPLARAPWGEARRAADHAEARFQARVEELATYLGWFTWHVYNARFSKAGFPDLVFIRERVFWAELKATSQLTNRVGKVSPVQADFLDRLRGAGAEVYLWYDDSEDWEQIKAVLSRGGSVVAT